jgi:hypothetical protein
MANGWTPERRARQAELIRSWRPWEHSTGPKSDAGKSASSRNADKDSLRVKLRMWRVEVNAILKAQRTALEGG